MGTSLKIKATYKGGVLIPFEKINLNEGERLEIEIKEKKGKTISLRGLWKGVEISEGNIEEAKHIWEEDIKKQIKILEDTDAK